MAEVLWYYAQNDQQKGPVSGAELRQLAASGKIAPQDLIWKEGMEEWAPAQKVKGLFPDAKPAAVAPPVAAAASAPAASAPAAPAPSTAVEDPPPVFEFAAASPPAATPPYFPAEPEDEDDVPPAVPRKKHKSTPAAASPKRPVKKTQATPAKAPNRVLSTIQALLWVACGFVVLVGGILFTIAFATAKEPSDQLAAGATYSTFFIGAYVVARAGERIVELFK